MAKLLTDEHLAWIGRKDDPVTIEVSRKDIVKYSIATEQVLPKFLSGDEAPPMFIFNLFRTPQPISSLREDGLPNLQDAGPELPLDRVMAGGTKVTVNRAIRPGDVLTSVSTFSDIYEKSGSSGPLIFCESKQSVSDQDGNPVFTAFQTRIAR